MLIETCRVEDQVRGWVGDVKSDYGCFIAIKTACQQYRPKNTTSKIENNIKPSKVLLDKTVSFITNSLHSRLDNDIIITDEDSVDSSNN